MSSLFNKERAYSVMEKYNLVALVGTTPPNVNYLSNYGALSYENIEGSYVFAIFFANKNLDPTLIVPLVKAGELISTKMSSITDIRTYGKFYITIPRETNLSGWEAELAARLTNQNDEEPFKLLRDVLEEKKVLGQRVGIDERVFRGPEYERLHKILGGQGMVDASEAFKEIRMVKTPDQIAIILEANRITEEGLKVVIESVRPGWTSMDAVRLYCKTVAELDALPFSPTITFGENGYLPNSFFWNSRQKMSKGDLIRFDVTCVYKYHYTDVGRNAVLGNASEKQRKLFEVAYQGEEEAIATARPGATASEIFRRGVEGARQAGMPEFNRVHCGHGIGLELYENPTIAPDNLTIMEDGTVINVETPFYEIRQGAFIVEDTLVVSRSGPNFMSRMDRGLIEIGV